MIQPRYSRLSSRSSNPMFRQALPTGKGFGGSSLKFNQSKELVFSIVSDSVSISGDRTPVYNEPTAPLVIEVGKIIVVALWFWCLIGANFCFDSVTTIIGYGTQDL
jgi:hypothetical protein